MNTLENEHGSAQPAVSETLISEVEALLGASIPMATDVQWQVQGSQSAVEMRGALETEEERLKQEHISKFETLVRRNVLQYNMQKQQILRDAEVVGPKLDTVLDQLSMRMTLWQYEELHAKSYVDVLRRYLSYNAKFPDVAYNVYQKNSDVRDWDTRAAKGLQSLKVLLPTVQLLNRLFWFESLLQQSKTDKERNKRSLSDKEIAELETLIQLMRMQLPQPNELLTGDLAGMELDQGSTPSQVEQASFELQRRLRTVIGARVTMTPETSDTPVQVHLPDALLVRTLHAHRMTLLTEMRNDPKPNVERFNEFVRVQEALHQEVSHYLAYVLKLNADMQSLLITGNQLGPEITGPTLTSNEQRTKQLQEFFTTFIVPEDIEKGLTLEEIDRLQEGMETYMSIVTEDIASHNVSLQLFESMLMGAKKAEDLLSDARLGVTGAAYAVPEWTLGFGRVLGLDYLDAIGQSEEFHNLAEVQEFIAMELESENLLLILHAAIPAIQETKGAIEADMATLRQLQIDFPPSQFHQGVPSDPSYEEVRQKYSNAISQLREHQSTFAAQVSLLYKDIDDNVRYHAGRMEMQQGLEGRNFPDPFIGLGVTAVELAALWKIGGAGGVRSLPVYGRVLRPFINRPTTWFGGKLYIARGAVNAPGRMANALTRPVTGTIDLARWYRGSPLLKRVPYDMTMQQQIDFLRKELAAAWTKVDQLTTGTAPSAPQAAIRSPLSVAEQANARIDAFRSKPSNLRLFNRIERNEAALVDMQKTLSDLLANRPPYNGMDDLTRGMNEKLLRSQLNDLQRLDRTLRAKAAGKILGRIRSLSSTQIDAILQAHTLPIDDLAGKEAILRKVFQNNDDVAVIMRSGLSGSTEKTLALAAKSAGKIETVADVGIELSRISTITNASARASAYEHLLKTNRPLVAKAAAQGNAEAAAALKGGGSRLVSRGIIALGVCVDLYLIYDNEIKLNEALQKGKLDDAYSLSKRRISLGAAATGGGVLLAGSSESLITALGAKAVASSLVTLPAAVALAGGVVYSDALYAQEAEIRNAELKNYLQMDSREILTRIAELTDTWATTDLVTDGAEIRRSQRERLLHAYLFQKTFVDSGEESLMDIEDAFDLLPKDEQKQREEQYGSREEYEQHQKNSMDLTSTTQSVSRKLLYMRHRSNGEFADMDYIDFRRTEYFAHLHELADQIGPPYTLTVHTGTSLEPVAMDLSILHSDRKISLYWDRVEHLIDTYAKAELFDMRNALLVHAENRPEDVGEHARVLLLHRLQQGLEMVDADIESSLSREEANAVRADIHCKVRSASTAFQPLVLNPDNSIQDITVFLDRVDSMVHGTPKELYDAIEYKDLSHRFFNPLKYALEHPLVHTGQWTEISVMPSINRKIDSIRSAELALREQLNVPLESAILSLFEQPNL